jgi:hypothetical protein
VALQCFNDHRHRTLADVVSAIAQQAQFALKFNERNKSSKMNPLSGTKANFAASRFGAVRSGSRRRERCEVAISSPGMIFRFFSEIQIF